MRRLPIFLAFGLVFALLVVAAATAAPADFCGPNGTKPHHPSCGDTVVWTCAARVDNGATGWVMGEWVDGDGDPIAIQLDGNGPVPASYRTDNASGAIPACIDIHPDHFSVAEWTVEWDADEAVIGHKRHGGLKMLFEREVHSDVYAGTIARDSAGEWNAVIDLSDFGTSYEVDNLVFVAMPGHRDTWLFDDGYVVIAPAE